MLETLTSCPYCQTGNFSIYQEVIDYTVSRETFMLCQCTCGLIFTNPRPDRHSIAGYYQSEDYISHTNSSKGLINKLYQVARKISLKRKLSIIKQYSKSGDLLDIGCGTGEFLAFCKNNGFSCAGIEPDAKARQLALNNHGLNVMPQESLESLQPSNFDIITMWHVLEHVHDLNASIKRLNELLKPDGHCIIAVPNPESYDAVKYKELWAAFDVPRHLFHFRPSFLKRAFENHGFLFQKSFPMPLDAYYVSLLSEKYKAGKVGAGVLAKAALTGLLSNSKAHTPEQYSSVIYAFRKAKA